MAQIENLSQSLQIKETAKIAREDPDVLREVIGYLKSEREEIRMGGLLILEETVRNLPPTTRKEILKDVFVPLVALITREPEKAKAMSVLRKLVENLPLTESQFTRLLGALRSVDFDGATFLNAIELASSIQPGYYANVDVAILDLVSSRDVKKAAIGLKLALVQNNLSYRALDTLTNAIVRLMDSGDTLLIEIALEAVQQLLTALSGDVLEMLILRVHPRLVDLSGQDGDRFIRNAAKRVLNALRNSVYTYYRTRPDDVMALLERLKREGLTDEVALIGSALMNENIHLSSLGILLPGDKVPKFIKGP